MITYSSLLFSLSKPVFCGIGVSIPWKLHLQQDARILNENKRADLERKIQELANKLKIGKPIELLEIKDFNWGVQAQGTALLPGRVGIVINPSQLLVTNEDLVTSDAEMEFLIAHELSHIKTNDFLWMVAIPVLCGEITNLAMSILYPSSARCFSNPAAYLLFGSPSVLTCRIAVQAIFFFFARWREKCADRLGFSICSDTAKGAAFNLFERTREKNIETRNAQESSVILKYFKRLLFTQDGECRFDLYHPSLQTRIRYLRQV